MRLRVGDTHDFDALLERLVELAYTRVEMVTARGEFAVRGGIVDVFPPTAEHPVRVEFWGDEVSELRAFARRRPALASAPSTSSYAPGCRELLLTDRGAGARPPRWPAQHENNPPLRELLDNLAEGIPAEGMESLIPALVGDELRAAHRPAARRARHVLLADPERIRTRAPTWSAPARSSSRRPGWPRGTGGGGADRPRRRRPTATSADVLEHAARRPADPVGHASAR